MSDNQLNDLEPLRFGVLGVAAIAVRKVIPAIQTSTGGRVTAIASRSHRRAEEAAQQLGIPTAFGDYRSLLESPEVDAVYIPLPNHLHLDWTLAAADAGKHVLCEKPLTLTSADARRMAVHCENAGVRLMEAFMYRLHPLWKTVVHTIADGAIGEVRAIQTVFAYFNDDAANIRNDPSAGGGALYDIGCYAIDLSRHLFKAEPTSINACVHRDPSFGTDDLTSVLLDFDGRHSTFVCSTQLEPAQRVEVFGTSGRIVIEIPFNIPPRLPTRFDVIAGGDPPVTPHTTTIDVPAADPYSAQVDAFATAVRLGLPMPIPTADSIANLEVIETILSAASAPPMPR